MSRLEMAYSVRDLSSGVRLRVTGNDRIRFLNGQTTCDVRKVNAESAEEGCVLNAKGHIDAHFFLFATGDAVWLSAEAELREQLPQRLERYVIADDVTIEDVTNKFGLLHLLGEAPPSSYGYQFCLRSQRLGRPGWDIWIPVTEKEKYLTELSDAELISETAWEIQRVEQGIPRWGWELTQEVIPPEANLTERAIDYDKGCYIGQEVISRMKMSGQVRQRLCGVFSEDERELISGMELSVNERAVGRITTAVFSPRLGGPVGLAMIKRGFTEPGTNLLASIHNESTKVTVSSLPFPARSQI